MFRYLLPLFLLIGFPAHAGIESYSTTPASNNSSPPNGAPEGMAPSAVNDTMRQMMADTRSWYEDAQWVNLGYTHTYASSTSFTIASTDVTSTYTKGRRVRAVGSSTGTIYGTISASSFSTNTTVTVAWDSGSLSNESLTVSLGALTPSNNGVPYLYKEATAVASASTVDLDAVNGDFVHITGTTTITAFTLAQGQRRHVVFDGALTLTHNGTSLILPGGANITTAAGDSAVIIGEGSSNVRVVSYTRASGVPSTTGSWTPALSSTGATFSYSQQVGTYVKVGNLVLLEYRIALSGAPTGTTTNSVFITGSPFNTATVSNLFFGGAAGHYMGINLVSGTNIAWQGGSAGNTFELKEVGDNLGETSLIASTFGASAQLRGTIMFVTD